MPKKTESLAECEVTVDSQKNGSLFLKQCITPEPHFQTPRGELKIQCVVEYFRCNGNVEKHCLEWLI